MFYSFDEQFCLESKLDHNNGVHGGGHIMEHRISRAYKQLFRRNSVTDPKITEGRKNFRGRFYTYQLSITVSFFVDIDYGLLLEPIMG